MHIDDAHREHKGLRPAAELIRELLAENAALRAEAAELHEACRELREQLDNLK